MLDVVEQMQLIQPSACIQLSKKNPEAFLRRALEVVRTGYTIGDRVLRPAQVVVAKGHKEQQPNGNPTGGEN